MQSAIIRNLSEGLLSMAAFYHRLRSTTAIGPTFASKPARLELRLDRQISFAFGIDHEKPALPLAHAGRFNAFQRLADHVQHAALTAVHRRKAIGLSGLAHFVGGGFSREAQFLGAQSLEVGGVKAHHVVLVVVQAQHLRGQSFDSPQQFSVVLDHQGNVGPGQFNADLAVDLRGLSAFRFLYSIGRADAVFEAQPTPACSGSSGMRQFSVQPVAGHQSA